MKDSTAPVTKADLDTLETKILERLTAFETSLTTFQKGVQADLRWVGERVSEVLTRLAVIDDKLDGEKKSLLTEVHDKVCEDHALLENHARRIERLERHVGIAA